MQNHLRNFIACSVAFVLFGCSSGGNKSENRAVTADTSSNSYISSSAAVETKMEGRKFIRTADLKFRVKNVIQSTYEIENITARMHGFVTHTHLSSDVENVDRSEISSDSSLVSTTYRVINTISIRVPNTLLDSTLKEIAKQVVFLDYRTIDAEDVQLQILANQLTEKRNEHFQKRVMASGNDSSKKHANLSAEESLLITQEQKDNAQLDNLKLNDQINYSSISLSLYQNQTIQREMVSNNNTSAFEPGFFYKLWDAIKMGWNAMTSLLLSLTKIWAFILVALVAYFGWKAFWSNKK
ncbi:MAG: DUF4349 domain-containing protein [Bacteroidota bacterium]